MEAYREADLKAAGLPHRFIQENHSGSKKHVLRGLHYQIKHPQAKLVRVIAGAIFDVAVDLDRNSPNFGSWSGFVLSADNRRQMVIPSNFAHGFYVLSDWAEITYKVTDVYAPEHERTLLWNDPQVGIDWPLAEGKSPLLSAKDAAGNPLAEAEVFAT